MQILCPFCEPPHPIAVGQPAACGTALLVKAVQVVYPTRTVNQRGLKCIKCHQGGGKMVQFNQGFVHLHECTPGTKLMAEAPQFTRWAQFVFGLPLPIRNAVERFTGAAKQVKEVDPEGHDTGKTLGYFFFKSNGGSNAHN